MTYVQIEMNEYIDMLEQRRSYVADNYSWKEVPEVLWEYFIDLIRECGVSPEHSSPSYVVDNFIVNGDWGVFDNYKYNDESDEEFIERVQYNCMCIFPDERIVAFNFYSLNNYNYGKN